jgi:hypothetical protein
MPASLSCSWPKERSSSSRSVYGVPPTTFLPAFLSLSASEPKPRVSSKTMTSAQSTSLCQSFVLGTNPSAMSRSDSLPMKYRTSCPSLETCQAMSPIRAP